MPYSFFWAILQLPVPSSLNKTYEDGTDRVFRNVGTQHSDAGESPKKQNTAICNICCPFIGECIFQYTARNEHYQICVEGAEEDIRA
jgi:hypothetical protein